MSSHAESLRYAYATVKRCRVHFGIADSRVRCTLVEGHKDRHCAAIGLYWEDGDACSVRLEDTVMLPAEQAEADHVESAFADERAQVHPTSS